MRVVVTGAAGFIGQMVTRALDAQDSVMLDGVERRISAILATDIVAEPLEDLARIGRRIHALPGALTDPAVLSRIVADAPDLIVHLAAVPSGGSEADYDLGLAVNLQGALALVDACRQMARPPVLVAASTSAVFSSTDNGTLSDSDWPAPLSSYGAHKLMAEILFRDATRKGFLRARVLRYPTITVRPGKPNTAASSFASGIIREPLAGEVARLPVGPATRLHVASPSKALEYTLQAAALPQAALGLDTAITLPGISVTVAGMIDALARVAGPDVAGLIRPEPDPGTEALVLGWPGEILAPRALALGFTPNADFDEIIAEHQARMAAG